MEENPQMSIMHGPASISSKTRAVSEEEKAASYWQAAARECYFQSQEAHSTGENRRQWAQKLKEPRCVHCQQNAVMQWP
ncbi:hypothetical protein TRAPUB_9363 [Trametes pubescens]|uniref:Uncharacterized protein n=1 Tax=Trametes pubescens TaxID=154538 RepID=A0A1M2W2K2_TRAPU|nr:hypothetical protein TRAPUB_9363 [Trametes pubescens]